jgi:hypothetical protein
VRLSWGCGHPCVPFGVQGVNKLLSLRRSPRCSPDFANRIFLDVSEPSGSHCVPRSSVSYCRCSCPPFQVGLSTENQPNHDFSVSLCITLSKLAVPKSRSKVSQSTTNTHNEVRSTPPSSPPHSPKCIEWHTPPGPGLHAPPGPGCRRHDLSANSVATSRPHALHRV